MAPPNLRLLTVAFPQVEPQAAAFMRSFQRSYSTASQIAVPPHFTLVFGCSALPRDEYVAHVSAVAARSSAIRFSCKYAMLGADDEDDRAYVFLVPDQGNAAVSLLHDQLYSGPLASHLRLDLPYVPHITIAVLQDRRVAKALCDQLNTEGVCVEGGLTELTVGDVSEGQFNRLSTHKIGA